MLRQLELSNILALYLHFALCHAEIVDSVPRMSTTKHGELLGKVLNTPAGNCDAFLGVPFAEPPVGALRFQKPQELKNWTGVRNATQHGPKCIEIGNDGKNQTEQSEDCLVLNIFAPRPLPAQQLPVMVYIHGGAFLFGSARDFGEEGPCENLVSREVILVVIQYRLFMYGFFSTGDEVAPGNYAIWDQIAALRWVQENIANFGGDPRRVTLFGESVGASSVSYLTYTTVAKDLFHQTLTQSGSAFSTGAGLADVSIESGKKVARSANCANLMAILNLKAAELRFLTWRIAMANLADTASYVRCLRRLSTVELQHAYNTAPGLSAELTMDFYDVWRIRMDGELFTSTEFVELGTRRPAVIGVNSMEMPRPNAADIPHGFEILNTTLTRSFIGENERLKEILDHTARYVYIDSKGNIEDGKFVYEQAVKMQVDQSFHAACAYEATLKEASGSPTWVYNFDHWGDNVFPSNYPFKQGAPHASELCYVFLHKVNVYCPDAFQGVDKRIANIMGEMWTNFVRTSNPSPASINWPQFVNLVNSSTITICRENLSIETHFHQDVTNFWFKLVPSIRKAFVSDGKRHSASAAVRSARVWLIASIVMVCISKMFQLPQKIEDF